MASTRTASAALRLLRAGARGGRWLFACPRSAVPECAYSSAVCPYGRWRGGIPVVPRDPTLAGSIFVRHYAKGDGRLLKVLKDEVEHEKSSYLGEEAFDKLPPSPFKLLDKPGSAEIILQRKFESESIELLIDSRAVNYPTDNELDGGEDEEERNDVDPSQNSINARLVISKGSVPFKLEFDLSLEGASWIINGVSRNILDDLEEVLPYEGPDYGMLDPKLQEEFENYLMHRGIDTDLAEFVRLSLNDKEQKEYLRWLKDVADFLSK